MTKDRSIRAALLIILWSALSFGSASMPFAMELSGEQDQELRREPRGDANAPDPVQTPAISLPTERAEPSREPLVQPPNAPTEEVEPHPQAGATDPPVDAGEPFATSPAESPASAAESQTNKPVQSVTGGETSPATPTRSAELTPIDALVAFVSLMAFALIVGSGVYLISFFFTTRCPSCGKRNRRGNAGEVVLDRVTRYKDVTRRMKDRSGNEMASYTETVPYVRENVDVYTKCARCGCEWKINRWR